MAGANFKVFAVKEKKKVGDYGREGKNELIADHIQLLVYDCWNCNEIP